MRVSTDQPEGVGRGRADNDRATGANGRNLAPRRGFRYGRFRMVLQGWVGTGFGGP